MNERDLEARLRSTYQAEAERADPRALVEPVHSIPAAAEPERRRWWHGGAQATGGIRMLMSMRTAAVVAVFALTTSLLAVQIGTRTETVIPGAAGPSESWTTVTGTQEIFATVGGYGAGKNTMTDPRFDGDVAITWVAAAEDGADELNDALWGTVAITNDGGTWQGQWVGFVDDQGRHHVTSWFDGTGDYAGLRYIEQGIQRERGGLLDTTGLVYEGDPPSTVIPPEVAE